MHPYRQKGLGDASPRPSDYQPLREVEGIPPTLSGRPIGLYDRFCWSGYPTRWFRARRALLFIGRQNHQSDLPLF